MTYTEFLKIKGKYREHLSNEFYIFLFSLQNKFLKFKDKKVIISYNHETQWHEIEKIEGEFYFLGFDIDYDNFTIKLCVAEKFIDDLYTAYGSRYSPYLTPSEIDNLEMRFAE